MFLLDGNEDLLVQLHMALQVVFTGECDVAKLALKGPFASVSTVVTLKIVRTSEG